MNTTIQLNRTLGLWSVVLFGLAYMTPMIVFGTFGALADISQGTTAMAYIIAAAAISLTAISYGTMARTYPVAGSAYTYARKSINSSVGFLVGWAVLLDYFFLPMVIWLIGAAYLHSAFPSIPSFVWIIGFIVLTTGVNVANWRTPIINLMLVGLVGLLALTMDIATSTSFINALFWLSPP